MIERVELWGFKSIGPEGLNLPFAPITLLLGENSIGKSSILHSLLALQQSWEDFASVGSFTAVGRGVDLGRFSNVQYRMGNYVFSEVGLLIEEAPPSRPAPGQSDSGRLEVEVDQLNQRAYMFCWDSSDQLDIPTSDQNINHVPEGWPEAWRLSQPSVDRGRLSLMTAGQFEFRPDYRDGALKLTLTQESAKHWLEVNPCPITSCAMEAGGGFVWHIQPGPGAKIEATVEIVSSLPRPEKPEEVSAREAALDAYRNLQSMVSSDTSSNSLWRQATLALEGVGRLRSKILSICHVGGIRHRGKRLYEVRTGLNTWSVGPTGENIVDLLVQYPEAIDRTNELLDQAKANYHVHLSDPGTQARVRELLLQDVGHGATAGNLVGLPDVGTGISQLLPIAIQIAVFMLPQKFNVDPLFLIEQPELHLHPKLQAHLASMLASAVTLEFDGEKRGGRPVQFLIETHSEHLVRALTVLVEKGILPPGAVSIIKLWRDQDSQTLRADRIRLASDGRFQDQWPEGFFPERERLENGRMP